MVLRTGQNKCPWSESVDSALQAFAVDPARGLTAEEILAQRRAFGRNQLQVRRKRHVISILKDQFAGIVVVLLAGAGVLALLFADIAEAIAIFIVILINASIGFFTEWRAIRSMEALRRIARVTCVVLRAGTVKRAPAEELVPGDIVLLQAGDVVPADLRLIEAAKLNTNESTLTGESIPVHKYTDALAAETVMFERCNMAYKGSAVTRGVGRGLVVATGMQTELGRIFEQVSEAHARRTPLEKRLDALGARLAWAVIVIGALLAAGGILAGREVLLAIEVAIALAVAAIPEGLPIVATIALARGMWRLARRNALITRLSAVETLGATSVILTDKTGTLTENRMAVTIVLLPHGELSLVHDQDVTPGPQLDEILTTAALCNGATLQRGDHGAQEPVGDPTEVALLEAASKRDIWREDLLAKTPEIYEDPFDPDRKRMATVHELDGTYRVAVKGAPEVILPYCTSVVSADGVISLDAHLSQDWLSRVEHLCGRGLRTLAVAARSTDVRDPDPYKDLTLQGVLGLEDPPREGIEEAIGTCQAAGVSVIMVTGDHAETARSVAATIGVTTETAGAPQFIGGTTVDRLFEEERHEELMAGRVFSRVTPEQKLRLIDLYQRQGHVVAMTGDGVNDAPALKKADIGVAMGLRGTAVAKEAADMVLQDDEFGTIVVAVEHGRAIFENIRKFVVYLLSCNTSEILVVSLATLAGAPLPLLPLQILFLNLVTDVFPALALGVGPGRKALMQMKPRQAGKSILARSHWLEIGLHGVVIACATLLAMAIAITHLDMQGEQAVTIAFCTLALAQLWHVFNMRGDIRQIIVNEVTRNAWVWAALALCLVLILLAVYTPVLSDVMQLSNPGTSGWLLVMATSLIPLLAAPLVKRLASSRD